MGKQNIQVKEVDNIPFTHEDFLIKSFLGLPLKRHFLQKLCEYFNHP